MDPLLFWHSGELASTLINDIKAAYICMIEVPPEIWIPKQENKYIVPYYRNGINCVIFEYKVYRK